MTLHKKTEKDNGQGNRASNSTVNDAPGSLLAEKLFRQALDRTDMPASAQKIGGYLVRRFNKEYGYAWPTVARIAFECSCSEATVYRHFDENTGVLREWFKVGKTVINGDERNTYHPDWAKAAAVNREFEIRLEAWKKAHADAKKKAANDNNRDRNDVPVPPESGAGDSQNERSRPLKMRGDDLAKCETIEARASNLRDRSYIIPERSAPGTSARSSEREPASGAGRHKKPVGNYRQTREQAERDWVELNRILTGTSEDAQHQPTKNSDRGAKVLWHRLLRSGVPSSQILQAALGYLDRKPAGQWQSGVAGFLVHFDPEQLPDGTYPEDERHTVDDNRQYDRAGGEGYG